MSRRVYSVRALVASAMLAAACVAEAGAQPVLFQTSRVSVSSVGAQGNRVSYWPSISADGRYVAFASDSTNLVPGDTNGRRDVFFHDCQSGATTRVSVSSAGDQGNSSSYSPSISVDGRYVAFESEATNLVPGDTNGTYDVFVHDQQTAATTLVSVSSAGDQGNSDSRYPSISADGQYVAFASSASNLVPGDTNGCWDVFVHDHQSSTTTRVSVSSAGDQSNGYSYFPSISADGQYVAFDSGATNLVPGDTNGTYDVFVHDRQAAATARVSLSSAGAQGDLESKWPSISADGRYVAFDSLATNLVPGDTNSRRDVFFHDRQNGATTRVSVSSAGEQGNGSSGYPSISTDGGYVAFASYATNLVPGDTNGTGDVFVHDRQTAASTRVSVSSAGEQGNGDSFHYRPSISADGRYVAFRSDSTNLVPGDTNGTGDVFVHDRACLSITTSPASQTVCAGQPVAFSVTAGGAPPTYQWRRNGIDIPDAMESTYAIPSATPSDAGSYDAVVTNGCGSLTSDPATLTVWPSGDGDVNDDGLVDGQDVQSFVDQLLAGGPPSQAFCAADMNGDGQVDGADVDDFVNALLGA